MSTMSVDLERALDELLGPEPGDRLPDRVYAATFERTATTTQRRSIGVLKRSPTTMSPMLRLMAGAAILALVVGGALVVGNQNNSVTVPPVPSASPTSQAAATPTPAVTAAPSTTPAPVPSASAPPLTTKFDSPTNGYSVTMPDGYHLYPARQTWDPYVDTQMDSPWLERIGRDDALATFTARSLKFDKPISSADWLTVFGNYPGSPIVGQADCTQASPQWQDSTVDGQPAFTFHAPCGPFWLVVAKGDRGYVFTWNLGVNDEPGPMAPYNALMAAVQPTIRLTPATAKVPASSPSP